MTSLPIVANISRVVSMATDRITGDRSDYPLLVAVACSEALKNFKIESRIMYGPSAWIEILENQTPVWAGCWGENFNFWVATQYGEIVDLCTSVAHRKKSHSKPMQNSLYAPPMLWSLDVPSFYRYVPEGIAEIELHEDSDKRKLELILAEVSEKCRPEKIDLNASDESLDFPNEPILCPGKRLLDDSKQTFKHFDRALSVCGLPLAPF